MRAVEFHPDAERELAESVLWYESQAAGLGAEFLEEIERSVAAVRQRPDAWPRFSGQMRRYLVHRFPYGLIYQHDARTVRVLAVMHLHRRPGYWADRRR